MGLGVDGNDTKILKTCEEDLSKITGQKPRRINDTSVVGKRLLSLLKTNDFDWFKSIELLCEELVGAYCFVILTPNNEIYAFRDTRGFRPLCIGWHKKSKTY